MNLVLSEKEQKFVGSVAPDSRGLRLGPLYEYYRQIVDKRPWLHIETFNMDYPLTRQRYQRMEIISNNLGDEEAVLDSRSGIHGEERYAVVGMALAAPEVMDYAHEQGVGLRMSVADNPFGLETFYRYNIEYYEQNARRTKKFQGTNDGVRFQLANGHWTGVIEGGREGAKSVKKWVLADERDVLPLEAKLPLKRLRQLIKKDQIKFERQRVVFFDPHEDHVEAEDAKERPADGLPGEGFYFCGYRTAGDYRKIVNRIVRRTGVPALNNRKIDTGDNGWGQSNSVGQVYKFEGSLGNAYYLLGAKDAVTVDFREGVRTPEMKEAIGIFMRGLIDMIA